MVTPISSASSSLYEVDFTNDTQAVHDTALFRKMNEVRHDLVEMKTTMERWFFNDPTTELIKTWHHNFQDSLKQLDKIVQLRQLNESQRYEQYRELYNHFFVMLQKILVDAATLTPLDEEPVLGSDNKVYGKKALAVFRATTSEELKYNAPANPMDKTPFSTIPHVPAIEMVRWLKKYDALPSNENVDQAYQKYCKPTDATTSRVAQDRLKRIESIKQKKAKERSATLDLAKEVSEKIEKLKETMEPFIEQRFQETQRNVEEIQQKTIETLKAYEEKSSEIIEEVKASTEKLSQDLQKLKEDTEKLKQQTQENEKGLSELQKANIELQIKINETQIAIEQAKEEMEDGIFKTLLCVGLSIVITLALPYIAPALEGVGAAVIPSGKSGAALLLTVPF